jgi:hypothetical protein
MGTASEAILRKCIESVTLGLLPFWLPVPRYACFLNFESFIIASTLFCVTELTFLRETEHDLVCRLGVGRLESSGVCAA